MKTMLCFFNDCFNIFLHAPKMQEGWNKISEDKKRIINLEGYEGTLRLTKYTVNDLEVYTFGLLYDSIGIRPGHRGEWSSNNDHIEKMFNIDLIPIGMGGISASIKREDTFKFVNKDKFYFSGRWLKSNSIPGEYFKWYDGNGNLTDEDHE